MSTAAIIVAAGTGSRVGEGRPKQFLDLGGRPLLAWSVDAFARYVGIDEVVVVLPPAYAETPPNWLPKTLRVAPGGATRAASVRAGLAAVGSDCAVVLIHDGARPFVTDDLIGRVLAGAASGPVVPAVPIADTVKVLDEEGRVVETPPREAIVGVQTPQGFPIQVLREAHARLGSDVGLTDDAMMCERLGSRVSAVQGEAMNFKVTTPDDLARARWLVDAGLAPSRR
ncbi:MAG: 2-C-methyl-D-erythritol 4-phosphate cytidylyltransferase [Gemmatimonadetes bacterium]|nr:2-C-methyl-D-erythritol 4-phosphate cytidylyltransferase [Gemmatimonadota bacterium]